MTDLSQSIFLPFLFHQITAKAPKVAIDSYQVRRRDMSIELASGNLDLAFDIPLSPDPQIKQAPLFSHPHVCVVRNNHNIIQDKLDLPTYLEISHIHISSRRGGLGNVDLALGKMGKRRHIGLRTQHYLATPELVTSTNLALTVPRVFAQFLANSLDVKFFELPFEVPDIETYLYWHESTDRDQANKWMRDLILELPSKVPWNVN